MSRICNIKDGDFVIFFVKEGQLYPVGLSKEEHQILQMMIPASINSPIKVLDKPQGEVLNLKNIKEETK
jgi:hypothetical protein